MFLKEFDLLMKAISPERAYTHLCQVNTHHRIQASPGYREAAIQCAKNLNAAGISTRILSYPADGNTQYWSSRMFKEWRCDSAWLEIREKDGSTVKLCDFHGDAHSVIQRSMPIDFSQKGLEVVLMDRGNQPESYADLSLKGKLLLIEEDFNPFLSWAVKEQGAVGFLSSRAVTFEGVRDRHDLYDGRTYQSFWYYGEASDVYASGFMLTPRQGDLLKEMALKQRAINCMDRSQPKHITLYGKIESALYAGEIEVVEATIPGKSEEEVLIAAHLCHPKTSANDNASGVAGGMEIMLVLKELLSQHRITLNRTVKLILIPEMTGTYAYLFDREKELSQMLCGINLDMIGAGQGNNYAPITLTALPNSGKSIIEDMAFYCMDQVARDGVSFGGDDISYYHFEKVGYSGGSDHYILSDPAVGVPTVMLGQWPDKYYHNSLDTTDKIDLQVLKRSIGIGLFYVYGMANLSKEQIPELIAYRRERFMKDAGKICRNGVEKGENPWIAQEKLFHLWVASADALDDIQRFCGEDWIEIKRWVADEKRFLRSVIRELELRHKRQMGQEGVPLVMPIGEHSALVPKRVFRGPIRLDKMVNSMGMKVGKSIKDVGRLLALGETADGALFWADGRRNLGEIYRCVYLDTGFDRFDDLVLLFHTLEAGGYIRFR